MPIKKIEIHGLNPEHPIAKVIDEINANLDNIVEHINGIDSETGVVGATGAKGDKGDPGQQGIEGPAGKDGKDGQDGKDGVDGKDGKDGRDGADGAQGLQGVPGEPSAKGDKGEPGIQGTPGKDGKDGLPGTPGANGAQGTQGIQGLPGKDGKDGKDAVSGTNLNVSYLTVAAGGGDEGGELLLNKPATNTSIAGTGVIIDVYQNKVRILEQGGTNRGAYLDLTTTGAGVGTNLARGFAAGYVDAGAFVTLDNLKFTVTTGGQRGLTVAAVTGTVNLMISGTFGYVNGVGGSATTQAYTYTTTPNLTGSWFGWSFPNQGDGSVYLVNDVTNYRFYRVTLMIGPGYTKNFISIERLY